jgi:hypothetical protein
MGLKLTFELINLVVGFESALLFDAERPEFWTIFTFLV